MGLRDTEKQLSYWAETLFRARAVEDRNHAAPLTHEKCVCQHWRRKHTAQLTAPLSVRVLSVSLQDFRIVCWRLRSDKCRYIQYHFHFFLLLLYWHRCFLLLIIQAQRKLFLSTKTKFSLEGKNDWCARLVYLWHLLAAPLATDEWEVNGKAGGLFCYA